MRTAKNLLLLWLSLGLSVMATSCDKDEDEDDDPSASNAYVGSYDGVESEEMTLENGQLIDNSSEDISSYVLIMNADGTYEVEDGGVPIASGTYNATTHEADVDGTTYDLDLDGDNLYITYQETSGSMQYQHQMYFLKR